MSTTLYMNLWADNNKFDQAVDNSQGLDFCVHIFDRAKKKIVVGIGLHS